MSWRYILKDLQQNKAVNVALAVVLVLSAFLMAAGAMVIERVSGSVNELFAQAKPPHFLQMHAGDYNVQALEEFAATHPEIEAWQVHRMVGFDGAAITWERPGTNDSGELSRTLIDNLFVTQNPEFDLLLDSDGAAPVPQPGQVYIPVAYQQQFGLQPGDQLSIATDDGEHLLRVQGTVRDAQMASSMSSATRFLVSDQDFQELTGAGGGAAEIIVEYRLTDQALVNDLQRAYEADAALPMNGQAVTYPMIRMINTISDGLVAMVLVLISAVLILIVLLNLRFVIRGSIEDDVRQIGALKAIGISHREISGLYLGKYRVMSLAACLIGGAAAVAASAYLTRGVAANYALAQVTPVTVLAPLVALTVVYLVVMGLVRAVLGRIKRVDVVTALVHGSILTPTQTARRARQQARVAHGTNLAAYRWGNLNTRLAWLDLMAERRRWALIPVVFFLTALVITVPANLLSTIQDPRFITYMGAPQADLRIDLQFGENLDDTRSRVLSDLEDDPRVEEVRAYSNVRYETLIDTESAIEGEQWETLRVEVGDYSQDSVAFASGGAPGPGEIALSTLNAQELGVQPGDTIPIRHGTGGVNHDDSSADAGADGDAAADGDAGADSGNQSDDVEHVRVSGVYQDVTGGGYTAKMQGSVTSGADSYVIYTNLGAGTDTGMDAGTDSGTGIGTGTGLGTGIGSEARRGESEAEAGATGQDAAAVAEDYNTRFDVEARPMAEYVHQTLAYLTDAMRTAAAVALILGLAVAGLITTLFLKLRLTRDRQKIGILTAVGFSFREISAQVLLKTLVAVGLGVATGCIVANTAGAAVVGGVLSLAGTGLSGLSLLINPVVAYLIYPVSLTAAGCAGSVILLAGLYRQDKTAWMKES